MELRSALTCHAPTVCNRTTADWHESAAYFLQLAAKSVRSPPNARARTAGRSQTLAAVPAGHRDCVNQNSRLSTLDPISPRGKQRGIPPAASSPHGLALSDFIAGSLRRFHRESVPRRNPFVGRSSSIRHQLTPPYDSKYPSPSSSHPVPPPITRRSRSPPRPHHLPSNIANAALNSFLAVNRSS